jgi:DNA-binding PadR family transcriptional regulator
MSSSTRLLVLGVVRIFQPVHGYDVRRELMSWHAEEWANVAPGSIYNALKTLAKEGCLEIVGTKAVGGRPERTTYKLTPRGEVECSEILRDTLWTVRMPTDPLVAAISLMGFIDRKELTSALEARAAQIEGQLKHAEYVIAAIDDIETPDHVREMMRLIYARVGAELEWSRALRDRLAAGEYRTLGDPKWGPKPLIEAAAKARKPVKAKAKPKRRQARR